MADSRSSTKSVPQPSAPTYTAPKSDIALCLPYFRTAPGIIKLIELSLGIICMACAAPAWTGGTHWFLFIVVTAFVATTLWCFIYLLNLKNAISLPIDWLLTELLNTSITTLLYLIAVIVQFCYVETDEEIEPAKKITAAVFGIFNFLAYLAGSFFLYRDWKDSHPNSNLSDNVVKRNP